MIWKPHISLFASIARHTFPFPESQKPLLNPAKPQKSHAVWVPVPRLFRHLATCSLLDSPEQRCIQSDRSDIAPHIRMVGHPSQ